MYKITKLEVQKKNKNRISVFINNSYAFGVHREIAIKNGLKEGLVVNNDELEEILKEDEQNKANSYVLNLLSYRPRSQKEIIDKMKGKGYENDVIENTISFLNKYNLLNDKDYAEEFTRIKSKKFGKKRIKMELSQKGIEDSIAQEVLENIDEEVEYNTALNLAQKRMRTYKNDDRNAIYRKLGAFLQRKGFSYDIIKRILKEILDKDQ